MVEFLFRRGFQMLAVLMIVVAIAFAMFRFVGDPVNNMVGQETTLEDRAELRERLGLDDPIVIQFGRFITKAVQGEFGVSWRLQRPVDELIAERMPATLELVLTSALIALLVGIPLGIMTGLYRDWWLSKLVLTVSLVGVSLPTFVIGIGLIYLFSVNLQWLPSFGRGELVDIGGWNTGFLTASGLKSLILPSITLGLFQLTLILRLVRAEMLEVMKADYIRFARARGLPKRLVHFGHALKNTLVPVITITGVQLGTLIAFSIITETVFQWPGMGFLFIQSVQFADVPVMAAYLVLVATIFVSINFLVDVLYRVVDPRLRVGAAR